MSTEVEAARITRALRLADGNSAVPDVSMVLVLAQMLPFSVKLKVVPMWKDAVGGDEVSFKLRALAILAS
eukprot:symbB.v1.2.005433.t1/scaffold312.1/size231221/9